MSYRVSSVEGVLEIMRMLQGERTQAKYAQDLGVSPQFLCDVMNNRREPGETITRSLGIVQKQYLIPETLYETASQRSLHASKESSQKAARKAKERKGSDTD